LHHSDIFFKPPIVERKAACLYQYNAGQKTTRASDWPGSVLKVTIHIDATTD